MFGIKQEPQFQQTNRRFEEKKLLMGQTILQMKISKCMKLIVKLIIASQWKVLLKE